MKSRRRKKKKCSVDSIKVVLKVYYKIIKES